MFELLKNSYDPCLSQECAAFNFNTGYITETGESIGAQTLFDTLKRVLITDRGLGVSASQLGIMARVFVIGDPDNPDSIIPVFNPTITNYSDEEQVFEEGCLSFPGLFIKIKRPESIRARFANINGDVDTAQFSGLSARVFLHEYDHLNGIVFTKRARRLELDKAYMQQKKLNRARKRNAIGSDAHYQRESV